MTLYALKSDEGYLKMAENKGFSLVCINKASVYPETELEKLKSLKVELKEMVTNLRLVKMTLEETDYFA
nr:hypothetical protein [uncultured Acetobacterium sp.]